MSFNTIISAITCKNTLGKKPKKATTRHQYIIEKYHERSITDRYFK